MYIHLEYTIIIEYLMEMIDRNKRKYIKPEIEKVKLDHEISVLMMSLPPQPGWGGDSMIDKEDPFQNERLA